MRYLRLMAAGFLAMCLASPALAGPSQEKITSYTVRAQELEAMDTTKALSQEIGLLRAWLQEAQSFLSQDEKDLVSRALSRVKVQTRLIEALLAKMAADGSAKKAHEIADAKEQEVLKIKNEAIALEKQAGL